jgi:translation initiation factor IF-2
MSETEVKNNPLKSEGVVEKRVKPTVIRRRKVAKPKDEVVPEVDQAAQGAAETVQSDEVEAEVEAVTGKAELTAESTEEKPVEGKRKSLNIIAQPEEISAAKGAEAGVAAKPEATAKEVVKRPTRKKKSRAELQYEDIQRHGGLKQYARVVTTPETTAAPVETARVFKPTNRFRKRKAPKKGIKKTQITERKAIKKVIKISEAISVAELSKFMGVKATEIIKKLMGLDVMATVNQAIDADTATLIATEYGFEVEQVGFKEEEFTKIPAAKKEGIEEKSRPPVVTVMGHVDHGKTSILDIMRSTNVAEGEAGGITQHIGAYTIEQDGKQITFVDTPGHEAFTHMRARGAQVTDIVILVVAADDGVMPQTKEAIDHARAAEVPIIVAVNKIDKANASQDKVKRELSDAGLLAEDWGGDTICVPTSAKTKEGISQLLEMILLQSEILELKARYEGRAEGVVVESRMDKRRGPIVTCLVKQGTLRVGDCLVSGAASGKVRALINDKGASVEEVLPSCPVEILGLSEVPEAGELFVVVEDDKIAKMVGDNRSQKLRKESLTKRSMVTLEDLKSQIEQGEARALNLIVKTDVKGVSDAIKDSLPGISTKDVKIKVLHTGVGGINESDIMLAAASNAVVLGFNVVADPSAREMAERESVEIKTYAVIYEMLDDIKKAIVGMLEPREEEKVLGRAEVRETFKVPKLGVIAGCMVTSGKILRSARVRLLRDNVVIHDGQIISLRRFKDDAKEVNSGLECGIGIEKFGDIKIGDEIEAYTIEKIAITWEESKG